MEDSRILIRTGKRRNMKYLQIVLLMTMLLIITGCYGSMTGTVVDAEKGKPIEGAVVLVEWTRATGIGDKHTSSVKVVEKITDKEGKFSVSVPLNPFVDPPDVTLYKKGYVAWSSRIIFPDWRNRADFKWVSNYTFRLEHFKSEYSYDEHTSFIHSVTNSSIGTKKVISAAYRWEELKASDELDEKWRKLQNIMPGSLQ